MEGNGARLFTVDGVGIIPVIGPMFKSLGSWGYADQTELRGLVNDAASDKSIGGIMLLIDSPGGSVSGTQDLAAAVAAANSKKPVNAYIEDLGASAAYWTATNASKIYSNNAIVGSIGVITELVDATAFLENMGVKIKAITTGKYKAAGSPTEPMTQDVIDYTQNRIDKIFDSFVADVSKGRGMSAKAVRELEAAVFVGDDAVEKGLVDKITSFDDAMSSLGKAARHANEGMNRKGRAQVSLCNVLAEF